MPRQTRFCFNWTLLFIIAIFAASIFLRFYHLGIPGDKVFDEVYFPVFANNYLHGTDFFDAHPPLGKLIIALGIHFFGNNPFGWRIANAVTGIILLAVVYGFTYDLTRRKLAALLALFLVAIDPMALVESRIGLINIYLALFSLLGLWAFWRWWRIDIPQIRDFIIMVICFACAAAVKWIGAGALAAVILFICIMALFRQWSGSKKHLSHLPFLILLPIVYYASFIPDILRGQDIGWWHQSAFGYHASLTATHPYGSSWWSWAIVERPVWFYFKNISSGMIQGIINIGNSVTWIAGLAAALLLAFRLPHDFKNAGERFRRNFFLLTTYVILYGPWIFIGRVKFIYHYFVPVLILLILTAIWLDEVILPSRQYRWIGYSILALGTIFFIYFLPLLIGLPISSEGYQNRMLFPNWI